MIGLWRDFWVLTSESGLCMIILRKKNHGGSLGYSGILETEAVGRHCLLMMLQL